MFWELTSRSSPLKFETRDPHIVTLEILNVREEPVPITNAIFVRLYQRCWECEPDKRSDIHQVNLQLKSIDSENNNASAVFYSKEGGISEKMESEDSDLSNCEEDCDLNKLDLNKIDNLPRFDIRRLTFSSILF
uniref:Serine-threonine/tyrosine-protein kinase catalytic domain-containing protein n=1 Tax=Rhizophagus irregularis (strain DAOM 181602 / DAOM 197198 / MUCL 43194) TaxID=747089 RepID=U9SPP3_RHIID